MKSDKPSRSDDSTKDEDAKLHCLCRTPYDNTKWGHRLAELNFIIQCYDVNLFMISTYRHAPTIHLNSATRSMSVWILDFISVATIAGVGITEVAWDSLPNRHPRRTNTYASCVANNHPTNCTASAGPHMMKQSKPSACINLVLLYGIVIDCRTETLLCTF